MIQMVAKMHLNLAPFDFRLIGLEGLSSADLEKQML